MHYTILLAQVSLVVFSLLDIVYLHTVVTFRGEKKSPFVIKVDRKNGALNRRWSPWPWSRGISTEVLLHVRLALFHVPKEISLTFVGRYSDIISETLAVCCCTAGIPLDLLASPFGPIGESMAIGVEAMGDSW
jgi:hypothetical protein